VPDDLLRSRRWTLRTDPRTAVRTAVVWEVLDPLLVERIATTGRKHLDVLDVGGGTGGFAVPLAGAGHQVTVVDPSPDALAALQRRAAEAGVAGSVRAEQGDAGALVAVVGTGTADLVLCHGVLEYVDDPGAALQDALEVLRPGGLLSLLVAQRLGALLARALAGRVRTIRYPAGSPRRNCVTCWTVSRCGSGPPMVFGCSVTCCPGFSWTAAIPRRRASCWIWNVRPPITRPWPPWQPSCTSSSRSSALSGQT
jgi:SAM-dependent methyltransferase